jgi:hypothetical protein
MHHAAATEITWKSLWSCRSDWAIRISSRLLRFVMSHPVLGFLQHLVIPLDQCPHTYQVASSWDIAIPPPTVRVTYWLLDKGCEQMSLVSSKRFLLSYMFWAGARLSLFWQQIFFRLPGKVPSLPFPARSFVAHIGIYCVGTRVIDWHLLFFSWH